MTATLNDAAVVLLLVLSGSGCVRREVTTVEVMPDAMSVPDVRSATNLPQQFTVVTPPRTPGDCPPLLRDTGLHTTLRLQRSVMRQAPDSAGAGYRALGDYAVEPHGRYGELAGEGVRVDCERLRAIGVVPLQEPET